MTLNELKKLLSSIGYPVTYSHFPTDDEDNPPPAPPFICYLEIGSENFFADGKVYKKVVDVDIELYTRRKDLKIEEAIEQLLNNHEIPWDSDEIFIKEENVFKKTYEIKLI